LIRLCILHGPAAEHVCWIPAVACPSSKANTLVLVSRTTIFLRKIGAAPNWGGVFCWRGHWPGARLTRCFDKRDAEKRFILIANPALWRNIALKPTGETVFADRSARREIQVRTHLQNFHPKASNKNCSGSAYGSALCN